LTARSSPLIIGRLDPDGRSGGDFDVNDASRTQGGLICVGVVVVAALFLLGLLQQSYWALAIPVAALVLFVLGLTFWVGYTIATIQVDALDANEPAPGEGDAPASSDRPA
jgi:hypothetical protein